MSGPKGASYTVSPAQQREIQKRIEEERRRREAELREAQRRKTEKTVIDRCTKQAADMLKRAETMLREQAERMRASSCPFDEAPFRAFCRNAEAFARAFANSDALAGANAGHHTRCERALAELTAIQNTMNSHFERQEEALLGMRMALAQQEAQAKRDRQARRRDEKSAEQARLLARQQAETQSLYKQIILALGQLERDIPDTLREPIATARASVDDIMENYSQSPEHQRSMLRLYSAQTVSAIQKQVMAWREAAPLRAAYDRLCAELGLSGAQPSDQMTAEALRAANERMTRQKRVRELQTAYTSLCGMLGIPPNAAERMTESELQSACDALSARLEAQRTRRYVSDMVADTMRDMGYALVGQRAEPGFDHNALYRFSGSSVIHVTSQTDGAISMEIGMLGQEGQDMTVLEQQTLVDDMHTFCKAYEGIKAALRRRNIEMTDTFLCPPEKEYAQVIVASDFGAQAPAQSEEQGRVHRGGLQTHSEE